MGVLIRRNPTKPAATATRPAGRQARLVQMERRVGASWIGGRCVVSVFGAVVAIVLVFGGASGARAGNDVRPAAESIARGPQVARSQGDVCLPGTTAGDLSRMLDAEPGGLGGADYQRA